MSARHMLTRCLLLASPLLAVPLALHAQDAMHGGMPGMSGMDHAPMDHGNGHAAPAPAHDHAKAAPAGKPAPAAMAMDHAGHGAHRAAPMPAATRSADDADGLGGGASMPHALPLLAKVMLDRVESVGGDHGAAQAWEAQAWFGSALDKLWLRSEGERTAGRLHEGDVEALWSHASSAFWDAQLGVRHDLTPGARRSWLAFGVQGLAPYWFELGATGYVSGSGRVALRLRASYDVRFTQRLILAPEAEANAYSRHAGGDADAVSLGLRLRYEIDPKFAPYVGVTRNGSFNQPGTATPRNGGWHAVAGLRAWF